MKYILEVLLNNKRAKLIKFYAGCDSAAIEYALDFVDESVKRKAGFSAVLTKYSVGVIKVY
jgi:hypothetical protein